MDTLRVDTALLRTAGTQLRVVAEVVRCFAHNWDDRRARMVEKIDALAQSASAVGGAFEELDSQFAAALRGGK